MNVHEYQAKQLLRQYGVPVAQGAPAFTADEAVGAAQALPGPVWVVKAQIHAGGRGKGKFKERQRRQRRRAHRQVDRRGQGLAEQMLGKTLVTIQTGPAGRIVKRLFIEDGCDIARELYLSALVDRAHLAHLLHRLHRRRHGHREGRARHAREDRHAVDRSGLRLLAVPRPQDRHRAEADGDQIDQCVKLIGSSMRAFVEKDMSLLEINPLVVTKAGKLVCLDAKINFDDNALFRHKDVAELRDLERGRPGRGRGRPSTISTTSSSTARSAAWSTAPASPWPRWTSSSSTARSPPTSSTSAAAPPRRRSTAAFKIILSDPNVKGILVNIFGGIMRCDIIAEGVVAAAKEMAIKVPLVVRLEGTNVDLGKQILAKSGLKIVPADNLADAAKKITDEVKKAA